MPGTPALGPSLEGGRHGLIRPAPVVPEIDHLLRHRLGAKSRLTFYAGIADGYYLVADLPRDGYAKVAALSRRFEDLDQRRAILICLLTAGRATLMMRPV